MIVRTWRRGDTEAVELQSAQQYLRCIVDVRADFTELAEQGLVWTAEHDGMILGIGGVEPQWENRATAFALLSDDSGPHFPAIHSAVVEFLDEQEHRVHYLRRPFQREPDFDVTSVNYDFAGLIARAGVPS